MSGAGRDDLGRVVGWMAVSTLSFTAMAVAVREAGRGLGVFETLSLRNALVAAVMLAAAALRPSLRAQLRPRSMGAHLVRNAVQFAGQYAWALAVVLLPLAQVFALEFATPLFAIVLATVFLRERPGPHRIAAVAAGVAGVLAIHGGASVHDVAGLLPVAAAFCFACSDLMTKRLTRTQSTFAILFWMNALQLPMNLVGVDPAAFGSLGTGTMLAVAAVAATGFLGHLALTQALRHGDASLVVPLDFARIPLVALVGAVLYGETVGPGLVAGSAILAAAVLVALAGEAAARRPVRLAPSRTSRVDPPPLEIPVEFRTESRPIPLPCFGS